MITLPVFFLGLAGKSVTAGFTVIVLPVSDTAVQQLLQNFVPSVSSDPQFEHHIFYTPYFCSFPQFVQNFAPTFN